MGEYGVGGNDRAEARPLPAPPRSSSEEEEEEEEEEEDEEDEDEEDEKEGGVNVDMPRRYHLNACVLDVVRSTSS